MRQRGRHRPFRRTRRRRAEKGANSQAIGRSKSGSATRIAALVDAPGYLIRFELLPGQAHDLLGTPPLLEGVDFGVPVGDKAIDADSFVQKQGCWLVAELEARGAPAAVPSKSNRKISRGHNEETYKWRQRIENYFAKITEFRAVATR